MQTLTTDLLEIAYLDQGPRDGPPVLLLHGWPDDPSTWDGVAERLNAAGHRTIVPFLRGFGPTRFLSPDTIRDGRAEALASDAVALMDRLNIGRFALAGHDWGARTAYALAALIPERLSAVATLCLGYSPRGAFQVPPFKQSRAWWYQWFMSVDRGADAVREDPKGFARIMWETWSPEGWFDDGAFEAAAKSFDNPDWLAITFNSYRGRWRDEVHDPRYAPVTAAVAAVAKLSVPTLVIQGGADGTVLPSSTDGREQHFTGPYSRVVLDGVGHFPSREAPVAVAEALLGHFTRYP